MQYFDHDTHAADDDAIMALRLEHGGAAVDAYWTLLEKIYRDERPVNLFGTDGETNAETKSVAHRLCIGCDELMEYVAAMLEVGLLDGDVENLYSVRAMHNINAYQRRAETARENGKKGGRKPKQKPTGKPTGNQGGNPAGTQSVAIKEKKSIGLDKLNQYQYEGVADAAEDAAPPSCSACQRPMEPTSTFKSGTRQRLYRCERCGEEAFA